MKIPVDGPRCRLEVRLSPQPSFCPRPSEGALSFAHAIDLLDARSPLARGVGARHEAPWSTRETENPTLVWQRNAVRRFSAAGVGEGEGDIVWSLITFCRLSPSDPDLGAHAQPKSIKDDLGRGTCPTEYCIEPQRCIVVGRRGGHCLAIDPPST